MKKRYSIAYKEEGEELLPERRFAYAVAAGFVEACFSLEEESVRPEALAAARQAGITAEALYLPVDRLNLLWEPSPHRDAAEDVLPSDPVISDESTWEALHEIYSSYFSFAASVGIERVVLLASYGASPARVSQEALSRFRTLAAEARAKGIRLLIENGISAPHFEAAVRVCCEDGYHGVSFAPALAFFAFGTSALPPYAAKHLVRVSLSDTRDGEFGYLPTDGDTDFRPFARSVASLHFRGTLSVASVSALPLYRELDYFAFISRAYDKLGRVLRLMKKEEGVV